MGFIEDVFKALNRIPFGTASKKYRRKWTLWQNGFQL